MFNLLNGIYSVVIFANIALVDEVFSSGLVLSGKSSGE